VAYEFPVAVNSLAVALFGFYWRVLWRDI